MGQVSSQVRDDGGPFATVPRRFMVTAVQTCPNDGDETGLGKVPLNPNASTVLSFDQTNSKVVANRMDGRPLEFVQDPETGTMVLKVGYQPSLTLRFKLSLTIMPGQCLSNLTFVVGSTLKEVDATNVELLQNPNLQNEDNVVHLGEFGAADQPVMAQVDFLWVWEPQGDRLGGWPLYFCFCEYDKDQHRLSPLVGGSLWIGERPPNDGGLSAALLMSPQHAPVEMQTPDSSVLSPLQEMAPPPLFPKTPVTTQGPQTLGPALIPSLPPYQTPTQPISQSAPASSASGMSSIPVHAPRPAAESVAQPEDGPAFRSMISQMERRSGTMKARVKQLLKRALLARERLQALIEADQWLASAVVMAAESDLPSLKPVSHWFDCRRTSDYGGFGAVQRQRKLMLTELTAHVVQPLQELYEQEIKRFELRKREFEDESSQFYSWVSRYLASTTKKKDTDAAAKYAEKKRAFELTRFDYYSYLLDIHGGRKQQSLLMRLALFAQSVNDSQMALGVEMAQRIRPEIDAVVEDVKEASKDWQRHRTDREFRRRILERSEDPGGADTPRETSRHHKEGLLWALSRPQDIQSTKWHKFWVVQDGGQLYEYTNWRQGGDLHSEPINLLVASVREAQTTERRFCFEVVTPNYRRIYQAPSDEDMRSWIQSISRGIASILDGSSVPAPSSSESLHITKRDSRDKKLDALTRKLSLKDHHHHRPRVPPIHTHFHHGNSLATAGPQSSMGMISANANSGTGLGIGSAINGGPATAPPQSQHHSTEVLHQIHGIPGNRVCADCGAESSVEWASINILLVLCIECSGAHRSLGSHISKIRSLTLDSFTPDLVAAFMAVSNDQINGIWEHRLNLATKIDSTASTSARLKFVSEKYVEKQFLLELEKPNAYLRRAIAEQNIGRIVTALAACANPNGVSDDDEPMIVHALRSAPEGATVFPAAEVLYVNGAALPAQLPQELSSSAHKYIEIRRARQ